MSGRDCVQRDLSPTSGYTGISARRRYQFWERDLSPTFKRISDRICAASINLVNHKLIVISAYLTRLPSKQELRWLRTRKPLAYRESTCTNLSVSCPYEIIVYSVLKHINTARMHTISRQFIPLIYCSLGKRILSKIQPILPFH